MNKQESFSRRLFPLVMTQFLGVFNDNAFKMLIILAMFNGTPDYFQSATFMFLLTAAYVTPFVIFCGMAGSLSDRLPKRSIIIMAKFAEIVVMGLGAICMWKIKFWGAYPMIAVMFLMTTQSAFFSPAYNGSLPETFPEAEISKANGISSMLSFAAAILGAGLVPFIWISFGKSFIRCGEMVCLISVAGFLFSLMVVSSTQCVSSGSSNIWKSIADGWRAIFCERSLWMSALGDAFFYSVGVVVQTLVVLYAKFILQSGDVELSLMMLTPAIGMGLGCYLCGILSGKRVELGFIIPGGLLLALFLVFTGIYPGSVTEVSKGISLHLNPLIFLLCAGIFGGFFIVPIKAFFQQWVNPEKRGSAIATSNLISFASMLIFSFGLLLLTLGSAKGSVNVPSWLCVLPQYNPAHLFVAFGLIAAVGPILGMILVPDLLQRSLVMLLTHTFIKVRVFGAEKIPEHGPVLLVSNHASFIDGLMICFCTSRRIRFLMHEDYYRIPCLHPFAKFFGYIEVPRGIKRLKTMMDTIHQALRNNEVVCVFPEGKISQNGLMDEFSNGYSFMIPEDLHVPVVPVRIGMVWGSIFSYYYGKLKFRLPEEIPHPVTVTFGDPIPDGTTPFELRQIISELGADTEMMPRPTERTLHYQLAKNAKRHPFKTIVVDYGGKNLNYFQIYVGSAILSRKYRKLITSDCKYIGIMLPNCGAAAVATLGIMMADKTPAIINFTASRDAIQHAIRKTGMTHIITSRKFLDKLKFEPFPEMIYLEDIAKTVTKLDKISMFVLATLLPHQEFMNLMSPITHRNVQETGAVLFSSGSTGIPKGVMLSHHNVNSDLNACIKVVYWTRNDVVLGNLPMFHAFGLVTGLWLPIMISNKVVYVTSPLDCAAISQACLANKVTIMLGTPTFMQSYLRRCDPEIFKNLRLAIAGAERLRMDIRNKFDAAVEGERALIEGYGCTELSPIVAINIGSSILSLGKTIGKPGSIGPAMPGICVKIVDPVTRVMLPPDTDGLMIVKGPNVMQGYLGEPALTKEVVQNGWYNTGDIGRMDSDGYITLSGRLSRFSKIGGEMVPHELVECAINEILNQDEKTAAVCSIPDPAKGEALVVFYTKLSMPPEKIVEEMRARNITNLWIPKVSNFCQIETLPILGTGKLDLAAMKKLTEKLIKERNLNI